MSPLSSLLLMWLTSLENVCVFYRIIKQNWNQFLANVNSRSRSLYAIARPSVCRLSVVGFVSDIAIFVLKRDVKLQLTN